MLTVIGEASIAEGSRHYKYRCKCACGAIVSADPWHLLHKGKTSCGGHKAEKAGLMRAVARARYRERTENSGVVSGARFTRLTVLRLEEVGGRINALCKCDCGKEVMARPRVLVMGEYKSCGCWAREMASKRLTAQMIKHGEAKKTAEYSAWSGMLARCYNKKDKNYAGYGGRGIEVCERWRSDYSNFLADVGRRPGREYSIDRHPNPDGNYEPGNVRWATPREQSRNRRSNLLFTISGETKCLEEWCELHRMNSCLVSGRLRRGWSIEKALTTVPARRRGSLPRAECSAKQSP